LKTYRIILKTKSSITSFPSSDTLFGAICWGIRIVYGEDGNFGLNKTIKSFIEERPLFVLSSSFPVFENENVRIFFYPKPIRKDLSSNEVEEIAKNYQEKCGNLKKSKVVIISELKKFKKVSYISEDIFKKIVDGEKEKNLFLEYLDGKIKLVWKLLMTNEEYNKIFTDAERSKILTNVLIQKNLLDRISFSTTPGGQIFYSNEYFLAPNVNLYFLLKTDDIDYLKPVFKYLEDSGIGRDRFTGKGNFKFSEPEEFVLPTNEEKTFITLSRYIPKVEEIGVNKRKMYYEIISYYSKVDSIFEFKGEDVFKDKVIYIKEGSIFEAKEKKDFYGVTPTVKKLNEKQILQYGLAFPIFGKVGE
jgi:CRISPR-associated protein Csm4